MKDIKFLMQKGFTLIELLIVLSGLAILSTIGIAAFVNYSRIQALNASTNDVAVMLQTAKSRAQSQVKPTIGACSTLALVGYKVVVCPGVGGCPSGAREYAYEFYTVCGSGASITEQLMEQKILPKDIRFGVGTSWPEESFLFPILTGGVRAELSGITATGESLRIQISHRDFSGSSRAKIIEVYKDGRIVVK